MERIDPPAAARVWQRVTAGRQEQTGQLSVTELLRRESENAAAYMALAKQNGYPRRRVFQKLAEDARHHCHMLQELLKK